MIIAVFLFSSYLAVSTDKSSLAIIKIIIIIIIIIIINLEPMH